MIKINEKPYSIDDIVIKRLNCKLLLENDFNIKNEPTINFKNKCN